MITANVYTNGVPEGFELSAAQIDAALALTVYRTGAMVRTRVRAYASGRPGPRVQTGDYRRSIAQTNGRQGAVPVAFVFTNSPQGRRLEYGFNGIDSAGRRFRQPPYPHWRPALAGVDDTLAQQADIVVSKALGQSVSGVLAMLRRAM